MVENHQPTDGDRNQNTSGYHTPDPRHVASNETPTFSPDESPNRPDGHPGSIGQHKVPEMPVEIDGQEDEPEAVLNYMGQPLFTVVDERALTEEILPIFTSERKAQRFIKECREGEDEQWPAPQDMQGNRTHYGSETGHSPAKIWLYEHENYRGDYWYADETYDSHNTWRHLGKWWNKWGIWGGKTANDRITSLIWNVYDPGITLYEHAYYHGDSLYLPGQIGRVPSLVPYGFNDKVSSIYFGKW